MGSRFSKKKDGLKSPKTMKEPKTRNGRNNPRMTGSTQSVNIEHHAVSSVPNPVSFGVYSQPGRTVQWHRSAEELHVSDKPGLRCKLKTPLPQDSPLSDLAVKFSDLKLGETIGSGFFSLVYAGTLHGNMQVAVKSLRNGGSMTVEEFRKEAETMHKLRHSNLVSLLAICEDHGTIYIITEKMSRGALLNLLRDDSSSTITFKDLMYMAIQVVEGMCYMERKRFVHRNLRAASVLVGDGNIVKIADFGMARFLNRYYEHEACYQDKNGSVFPYKWTAPEAITQLKFTVKSDVWSFGILLYEMVTHGDEPYPAMSNHEVLDWVLKGNRLKKPMNQHCPATLYNLMKQCWMINSSERPNFANIRDTLLEIKAHKLGLPFVANMNRGLQQQPIWGDISMI